MKKNIENEFVQIHIDNRILYIKCKTELHLEIFATKKILELFTEVVDKEKYYVIQEWDNIVWMDKQSRDYLAMHAAVNNMYAWAFISGKPMHNLMHMVYTSFSRPSVTTELFTNYEEAINWFKSMDENHVT
ncbi:MAG: hypothetical protein K2X86_00125 [Cytophagaceae bacterium]|nr:hypothetical protein [Cytophagaceae bacterium]